MRIHLAAVRKFMSKAGQALPDSPEVPSSEVRELRARLILEEAFETVAALGVSVSLPMMGGSDDPSLAAFLTVTPERLQLVARGDVDLVGVADGCADVLVVTSGTALACGFNLERVLRAVDESNLAKFAPGGYRRDDGKWVKPPDWIPPPIAEILGQPSGSASWLQRT